MIDWLWNLLGWNRYEIGTCTIWLRGKTLEDLPALRELAESSRYTDYVIDLHFH